MPYKKKVPKAVTLRGMDDEPELYLFIRALAETNRRAFSNQIICMLKEVMRQAELPGHRDQFFGPIPADAPEWRKG